MEKESWGKEVQANSRKGRKRTAYLVLMGVLAKTTTSYISLIVFGLRKRVVKFGSKRDSQFSPDWENLSTT